MKKTLCISIFLSVLGAPGATLAANWPSWGFARELALEGQVSPLGAAAFEDVPGGGAKHASFGLGFYHPRIVRPMFRNILGVTSAPAFGGRRIAGTREVEVVLIQPLPAISATTANSLFCPYVGWGFSLTVLELNGRHRGYSALVFETGVDIRQRAVPGLAGVRASIHVLAGGENFVIGVFLGTMLHPLPIIGEIFN